MMTWGAGWAGWLWMLAGLALVVGVVLVVAWAIQRAGGGPGDDAMTALRGRFARGEIDAAQFEEMRRVLGSTERPGGRLVIGELGRWSLWAAIRRVRGWLGSPTWRAARFRSASDLRALVQGADTTIGAAFIAVAGTRSRS